MVTLTAIFIGVIAACAVIITVHVLEQGIRSRKFVKELEKDEA